VFFFFCSEEGLECSFGGRFEGGILERPIWLIGGTAVDELHGDDACGDDFAQNIHGDWNEFPVLGSNEASVVIENFVAWGDGVGESAEVLLRSLWRRAVPVASLRSSKAFSER